MNCQPLSPPPHHLTSWLHLSLCLHLTDELISFPSLQLTLQTLSHLRTSPLNYKNMFFSSSSSHRFFTVPTLWASAFSCLLPWHHSSVHTPICHLNLLHTLQLTISPVSISAWVDVWRLWALKSPMINCHFNLFWCVYVIELKLSQKFLLQNSSTNCFGENVSLGNWKHLVLTVN